MSSPFNDLNIEEFDNLFSLMYIIKESMVRSGFSDHEAMETVRQIIATHMMGAQN